MSPSTAPTPPSFNHVTGIDLANVDNAARQLMREPRVKTVFKNKREGRITDFHFQVVA